MIFLFFLCLVRVESAVDFDSGGVTRVTALNVRRITKSLARVEPNPRFNEKFHHRLYAGSILTRLVRSAQPNRDESESKSIYLSPLRQYAQQLLDSAWVDPPISKYLTAIVIPGMVVNHGKVADLGRLSLTAVNHQFSAGEESLTNMTIFHGNLKTTYKYNLDGPKGRLDVTAPSRIYSIILSSKKQGTECVTKISDLALEKEEQLEFSAHGESSEDVSPHIKFLEHVLTSESRHTAYFNIHAAVDSKLQIVKTPLCQDIH